ncbi:LysM peptidoglycan-binding domain-containing protein [Vallicoccus soli]|uniref:LysM peptidoglycan-binding domain-containing protein n=1 Tax=Vallicoccus soli TaxID=2339232 RepID=A0A3A3Z6W3_9ACTN|nr:LysM peptidoglycan-binding domain-containing protein [Vallicoccus soli]RJK96455.1 LysM peptidoglycan-binding domain-containing protein [Vallicoccus soli]
MRSTLVEETAAREVARQRPAGRRGAGAPRCAPGEEGRRPRGAAPRRLAPVPDRATARWSTADLGPLVRGSSALAPQARPEPGLRVLPAPVLPREEGARECAELGTSALSAPLPAPDLQPGRRTAQPSPRRGARLTRRGRLVVTTLVSTLALAVAVTVAALLAGPAPSAVPQGVPAAVTVEPGDTLWSLAERVAPDRDPRDLVAEMRALNDLDGLQVGDQVLVPVAG